MDASQIQKSYLVHQCRCYFRTVAPEAPMAKKRAFTSAVIELSQFVFETLREDEEFVVRRGRRHNGELSTILLVAPVSEYPVPPSVERLEHEYSLREELDSDWAARPLALVQRDGRLVLILEDAGGEP